MKRVSIVKSVDITTIGLSSVFQIGDCFLLKPRSNVLAVQREIPVFWGDEGNLNKYHIYFQPLPKLVITEAIKINMINKSPTINVNNIKILGISAAAIVQIGSNSIIDSEARTKHIRYLMGGERPT